MIFRYKTECGIFTDSITGAQIRRVTDGQSINHHPFFIISAYDDNMRYLFFISHREGHPSVMAEDRINGCLVRFTDRTDLNEWSLHPSFDGKRVYYSAANAVYFTSLDDGREELLYDYKNTDCALKSGGMIADGMGTTALSRNGRHLALCARKTSGEACLYIIDTVTGATRKILERDDISHMQFKPDDENIIYYAGPLTDRVWCVNRDGTGNRRLYLRDKSKKEWITHESWIAGSNRLAFVDWPNGVRAVDINTGELTKITSINAWHAISGDDGRYMVCDTNFPDIGLKLFAADKCDSEIITLCYPNSSSAGEHWNGPFPYDDGPIKVYAPQHTHPHPRFSPDSKYVVYTSDASGVSQVYELELASVLK